MQVVSLFRALERIGKGIQQLGGSTISKLRSVGKSCKRGRGATWRVVPGSLDIHGCLMNACGGLLL